MGCPPALFERRRGYLRLLVPGAVAGGGCGQASSVPAGHRADDVLSRPVRGVDLRGWVLAVALRGVLGGAAGRARTWRTARRAEPGSPPDLERSRRRTS